MSPPVLQQDKKVLRRKRLRIGGAMLLVVLVLTVGVRYFAPPLLTGPELTELVIPGPLAHVQPQAVRAAVLPALLGKGFFSINVSQIQAAVQAVPWVAAAAVRRRWPHTLYIEITEEVPFARWNADALMDARGRIFAHSTDAAWDSLPLLSGPESSEQDVLAEFNDLAGLLSGRGLSIRQLTVDARGDSTVKLNNGIDVRLGRADADARLERFVAVALPVLGAKLTTVAYVDMRYTNGFAVGWASPGITQACAVLTGTVGPAAEPAKKGPQNGCTTPAAGHSNEVRLHG